MDGCQLSGYQHIMRQLLQPELRLKTGMQHRVCDDAGETIDAVKVSFGGAAMGLVASPQVICTTEATQEILYLYDTDAVQGLFD